MTAIFRRLFDEHPLCCIVIYIFVVFPLLCKLALNVLDVKKCSSYQAGRRRQNTLYTCEWNVNPLMDFFLDITLGAGPILGTMFFVLFGIAPIVALFVWTKDSFTKEDATIMKKEITPYGSLKKHREILLASGAKGKEIDEVLQRFRDPP